MNYNDFHRAIIEENIPLAKSLVAKKFPINTTHELEYDTRACWCLTNSHFLHNVSALHLAALHGKTKSVKYLLSIGVVDTPTDRGLTALHIAVHYEHKDIVALLLSQKNNLLEIGYQGNSTLDYATHCTKINKSSKDSLEIIDFLLKHGANANEFCSSLENHSLCPHYYKNQTYKLPHLHRSVIEGEIETTKILIKNGADVNQKAGYNVTPLHMASHYGFVEIVELLLQHGADKNIQDSDKKTAYDYAIHNVSVKHSNAKECHEIQEQNYNTLLSLLQPNRDDKVHKPAQITSDECKESAFYQACQYGQSLDLIKEIINTKKDWLYKENEQHLSPLKTALKIAIDNDSLDALELFQQYNISFEEGKNPIGHTSLLSAILENDILRVKKAVSYPFITIKDYIYHIQNAGFMCANEKNLFLLLNKCSFETLKKHNAELFIAATLANKPKLIHKFFTMNIQPNEQTTNAIAHLAINDEKLEVLNLLVEHIPSFKVYEDNPPTIGYHSLASAMAKNNILLVKKIISYPFITISPASIITMALFNSDIKKNNITKIALYLINNKANYSSIKKESPELFVNLMGRELLKPIMQLIKIGIIPSNKTIKDMIKKGIEFNPDNKNRNTLEYIQKQFPSVRPYKSLTHELLMLICRWNDSFTLKRMLNYPTKIKNYTPYLKEALRNRSHNVALLLLKKKCTESSIKESGSQLLHLAAVSTLKIVHELLNLGAKPTEDKDSDGYTAFHRALAIGNIELAQLLIEHGSLIDTIITRDRCSICCCLCETDECFDLCAIDLSPLHLSAVHNKAQSVEYLLKLGMVDTPTKEGLTALHIAVHHGNEDIVRLLLAQENNLLSVRYRGRSAYDYATSCNVDDQKGTTNLNIIHLLREHSADTTETIQKD